MYKRLTIKNKIHEIRSIKIILLFILFSNFQKYWSQSNLANNYSNDTIVVITTKENKEIRGLLISKDENVFILDIANENKIFNKDEIISYRFITRNQIKSIKEFENPNPIYTKYCYLPSAYIVENGSITTNSHYFITSNSKIGLHENFEFSIGNLLIFNIFSTFTYSKEISTSFKAGVSIIGNFDVLSSSSGTSDSDFNGIGIIPRITYGDKLKNTTIGIFVYQSSFTGFFYGGYLASQKKISEKFTLAAEIAGIKFENYYGLVNNLIINFRRNSSENWSFGVSLINVDFNPVTTGNDITPIPYIGIQRKF
jgi:small nuclear ribonucleoprotein (snRNP)-like protein